MTIMLRLLLVGIFMVSVCIRDWGQTQASDAKAKRPNKELIKLENLITTADVVSVENGALLRQNGKELKLSILTPQGLKVNVPSLDPPPLKIDKTITNLKRVEIKLPAYICKRGQGLLEVRLSGK